MEETSSRQPAEEKRSEESTAQEDHECRVCRSDAEPGRPLFAPCLCSGSISYVHQDCLEEWLNHSKKDKCELCGTKYKFTALYAEGMPAVVPVTKLLSSGLKLILTHFVPLFVRVTLAIFMWLCIVPLITAEFYRFWVSGLVTYSYDTIIADVISGIVLAGSIALSFIVMMSFGDFLRFNWNIDLHNGGGNGDVPAANRRAAARAAAGDPRANRVAAFRNRQNQAALRRRQMAVRERGIGGGNQLHRRQAYPQRDQRVGSRQHDEGTGSGLEAAQFAADVNSANIHNAGNELRPANIAAAAASTAAANHGTPLHVARRDLDRNITQSPLSLAATNLPPSKADDKDMSSQKEDNFDGRSVLSDGASSLISVPLTVPSEKAYAGSEASTDIDNDVKHPTSRYHRQRWGLNQRESFEVVGEDDIIDSWKDGVSSKRGENDEDDVKVDEPKDDYTKLSSSFAFSEAASDHASSDGRVDTRSNYDETRSDMSGSMSIAQPLEDTEIIEGEVGIINHDNDGVDEVEVMDDGHEIPQDIEGENALDEMVQEQDVGGAVDAEVDGAGLVAHEQPRPPEDDPQQVELEIHLVLDELIGIRAPAGILIRNASWLLVFNGIFVVFFGFMPFIIGSTIYSYLVAPIPTLLMSVFCPNTDEVCKLLTLREVHSFSTLIGITEKILELSLKSSSIIKIGDLSIIFLGYVTIATTILSVGNLITQCQPYFSRNGMREIFETIRLITSIVKVGYLLFIRIFCLPVVLGSVVLMVMNVRTQYSDEEIINFIANDVVSFLYLSWASGISFMLTVTLTVLQLREVLHPRILAKIIRSQEAHIDLLTSLVFDSAFTHIRRILVSLLVYMTFLLLFVYTPLKFLSSVAGKMEFHVWYGIPEVQIPLELLCSHILFLAFLDKQKDVIGQIQHAWYVYICKLLGMQRFLLPILEESAENIYLEEIRNSREELRRRLVNLKRVEEMNCDGMQTGDIIIARPPEGWETRGTSHSSRWAWENEARSSIEERLAPIVVPSRWRLRLGIILFSSWLVSVLFLLFMFTVPTTVGGVLVSVLRIPTFLKHEPVNFMIGIYLLKNISQFAVVIMRKETRILPLLAVTRATVSHALSTLFCIFYVVPQIIGLTFSIVTMNIEGSKEGGDIFDYINAWTLFQDWCFGLALVIIFFLLLHHGIFEYAEATLRIKYPFVSMYQRGMLAVRQGLVEMATSEAVSEQTILNILDDAKETLITPITTFWVYQLLVIAVGFALGYGLYHYHMIMYSSCFASHLYLILMGAYAGSFIICCHLILIFFFSPFRTLLLDFYKMIKDELYLVGKKLENAQNRSEVTATTATGSDN